MNLESELLDGGILRIVLDGRLDLQGTEEIDNAFTELTGSHAGPVLVDLGEVSFIASIGMRTLLASAKALDKRGGKMVLVDAQDMVRDTLETAGITSLLPLFENTDSALATFA